MAPHTMESGRPQHATTPGGAVRRVPEPPRAGRRTDRLLSPRWRRIALIAHVVVSVGWLGAAYFMIVLALAATYSATDAQHASFELLRRASDTYVMIPLSLLALGTGLVVSLGTKWGLARYYWVLTKLIATVVVMVFAALYVSQQVDLAASMAAVPGSDVVAVGWRIVLGSVGMCLVLLGNTILSVVKPWGRTARGRRALARRGAARSVRRVDG
jgi:hypothetical protein